MSLLIDAQELLAQQENLTVLAIHWEADAATSRASFAKGHIPGAVLAEGQAFARPPLDGEGRNPLPTPEALAQSVAGWGLSLDDDIVLYDQKKHVHAGRAWWVLKHAGFRKVRILNGGLAAWKAAGGAIAEGDASPRAPSTVQLAWGQLNAIDADQAAAWPERGILLDARSAARFGGAPDPLDPRPGHVPGAVNAPWEDNLQPDGRFRPAAELRQHYEALGVREGAPLAAYCGSGVSAVHDLIALAEAGFPVGALYVGSWSEWGADLRRPDGLN